MKITIELNSLSDIAELKSWIELAQSEAKKIDIGAPIDELGLDVRTCNILKAESIFYIHDLLKYNARGLLNFPNMGKRSALHIANRLAFFGLHLSQEES